MKITKSDKIRYLYEYAYWQSIDDYNRQVIESKDKERTVIRTSEARVFRERLDEVLKREGTQIDSAGFSTFINSTNEVLEERMSELPYPDGSGNGSKIKQQFEQYMNMTAMHSDSIELLAADHYLPISPYDPRYSDRKVMREMGSKLGGVEVRSVDSSAELADFVKGQEVEVMYNLHPRSYQGEISWQTWDSSAPLTHPDDISGMTVLMPYMTAKEYRDVSPWVNAGVDLNDLTPQTLNRRKADMQKSVEILQGLSDMGRNYKIVEDTFPGQIQARIEGTKTNVRVTEKPDSTAYIGAVYDDGARVMYSTTRQQESSRRAELHYATPEQSLDLVRFALGEDIKRWDDPNKSIGEFEEMDRLKAGKRLHFNSVYHSSTGLTAVAGPYVPKNANQRSSENVFKNVTRMTIQTANRTADTTPMDNEIEAETYLKSSIERARDVYYEALDVERLISESLEFGEDDDYVPEYDGDPNIATIQESYWDVLVGRRDTLLKPNNEDYDATVGDTGELQNNSLEGEISTFHTLAYDFEGRDPADIIREHALDSVEYDIGQYDVSDDGKRFNPVNVAVWDMSEHGVYRNNDDIVKALRILNIDADELRGDEFYNGAIKDRLIRFNETEAVPMVQREDPFMQDMYNEITTTLKNNGASFDEDDILIDNNGIVHYEATVFMHESVYDNRGQKRPPVKIEGEIGQLFTPNEKGVVKTQFAGSENYAFVPGYEAIIIPQKSGENKSVEERTRLRGYEQTMRQNIRYTMRQDILNIGREDVLGTPTSVNDTYRRLHDHRYDLDFENQFLEQKMPQDLLDAIVETQAARVRYPNEVRDGSTMFAVSNAESRADYDYANDNTGDTFVLTGGRNMAILTEEADGFFDSIATTSTGTNQGTLRYLTQDAQVTAEGEIIPGAKDGKTAIMAHDVSRYMEFNPFDRQAMTVSNLMQANVVTEPVMVGQLTFGGWTQDDAMVVSKQFADDYPMRNRDGSLRSLTIGDKLSDPNGNKGVISLVVDPDMDMEEAREQGLEEQVHWFKNNPDMAMVMAPFPAVSRFNGGTFREMTTNHKPLIDLEGNEIAGGLGAMKIIVTDKSVEAKTQAYDDEQIQQGKGRRASGQFAWALNSKDTPNIMSECYSGNSGVAANYREMLITTGLDMTETGEIRKGYSAHEGEVRSVIKMPETLAYRPQGKTMGLDMKKMTEDFRGEVSRKGGVLEIPFPLKYPTGEDLPPLNDGKTNVVYEKEEWERKGYTRKDGVYVRPTTVKRNPDLLEGRTGEDVTWGLPVMSSYLRSGQTFEDGTSSVHDYTNQYISIYKSAIRYKDAENWLKEGDLSPKDKSKYESIIERTQSDAQNAYDRITSDVISRNFEGKHNLIRDGIMSRRMPNSATVVWTPDPRLDIDQVALGPKVAEVVGIDPNITDPQYVMIWRDPILRNSGVRYMECVVDPNITGASINPNTATPFDGDFDGDTVAVVNLKTKSAQQEAMDKFSFEANLLDKGYFTEVIDPRTGKEHKVHPISFNDGLDIQVARHYDKELDDKWAEMTVDINAMETDYALGMIDKKDIAQMRTDKLTELSDYYRVCEKASSGKAYIQSDTPESHIESVWHACIETGAKGSQKNVEGYAKYVGFEGAKFTDKGLDISSLKDAQKSLATREEHQGVMVATAVKSFGTGVAGSVSQRGVRALRNTSPEAVLELTYPVTQAILQAKHDPVDAKHKYELLMGPVRDVWRGSALERDKNGKWKAERDSEGKLAQATPEEWKKSFVDFYTSSDGLNVRINPDYVDEVAVAMTDEDGYMMSVEIIDDKEDGVTLGSLMDRMAYGGDFNTLLEAADKGENLFEGKYNSQFAPLYVKQNQANMEQRKVNLDAGKDVENKPLRSLTKTDTIESGQDRRIRGGSKVSVDVRRPIDVDDIIANGKSSEHDDFTL